MKKNIKKFTNLALSAVLVMSIFTGCTSNQATPAETSEEPESKELTKVVVSEFRGMNYEKTDKIDIREYGCNDVIWRMWTTNTTTYTSK